ncbi:RNA polymerase-binding protein Rnk [Thiohalobacter sp. COW1]|uniref:GreA/GreB family elongation factor n=1 Tax=Thiohalobacter sp. COW1 TaxID=2795687 RepID=UPI0019160680|nr:GreA/GreB family elongation factor [Thiohalobacter sp. COW1]BCO31958.1 RNA polymerase-binding protein Rnk [Thiohalobacter sp. COW1]
MNPHIAHLTRHDVRRLTRLIDNMAPGSRDTEHLDRLIDKLQAGEELQPAEVPRDLVTMHSVALLFDMDSNRRMECTLVLPGDADASAGCISVLAPLGTALFGARVGDLLEVELPSGMRHWRVESLLYQPEAAGVIEL